MVVRADARGGRLVLVAVTAGALLSVALGVYGKVHTPTGASIALLGFDTMIQMKVWLGLVDGGAGAGPAGHRAVDVRPARPGVARPGSGTVHRSLGALALLVSLPVAYHCLWSIGFESYTGRVLLHSLAGCLVYGAFVVKVVGLHADASPRWLVPVAGGAAVHRCSW